MRGRRSDASSPLVLDCVLLMTTPHKVAANCTAHRANNKGDDERKRIVLCAMLWCCVRLCVVEHLHRRSGYTWHCWHCSWYAHPHVDEQGWWQAGVRHHPRSHVCAQWD